MADSSQPATSSWANRPWFSALRAAKTAQGLALLLVAAGAAAGILRLSFWLEASAPSAAADGWAGLEVPGYKLLPAGVEPAAQGRDLSHGEKTSFRVTRGDGQDLGMTLHLLPSSLRGTDDVSVGAVTKHVPELALKDPSQSRIGPSGLPASTALIGGLGERRAVQTCISPSGRAGVSTSELLDYQRPSSNSITARMRQIAGLQPPIRAECVLATLQGDGQHVSDEQLLDFSGRLLDAWRARKPWPAEPRHPEFVGGGKAIMRAECAETPQSRGMVVTGLSAFLPRDNSSPTVDQSKPTAPAAMARERWPRGSSHVG